MFSWSEIETRALAFQYRWKSCSGDEKQYGQTFEKDFMQVFGVDWLDGLHEHPITRLDGTVGYVDYFLPGMILVEIKSKGQSLAYAYTQAMSYVHALKPEEVPVLLMVSDFDKVQVYNLHKNHPYKPFKISQLKSHVRIFGLLAGYGLDNEIKTDIELNTDASYKMARIHDALKEYGYAGHPLEVYLVRLLFCLFADDTGIFEHGSFQNYVRESKPDGSDLSMRLMMLFSILDTPPGRRMTNLSQELNHFRYVNGFLFSEPLPPAYFSEKMRKVLLECCDFDWTQISPAIFGAMFQGVMSAEERRELGAHYTSEENILKVISPLFLEDLYFEFERSKNTKAELQAFHDKIAALTFLDPACGCGNFLIITYQKLRELEHEILKLLYDNTQIGMANVLYTKVGLHQFYGIELEDFPCEIAKVSLLLMKHLMDQEISHYFGMNLIDFPIRDNANIIKGNALRLDWAEVVPKEELDYIIGNPPFVGASMMSAEQKSDAVSVFGKMKLSNSIDYVGAWYHKACDYMNGMPIKVCFVSTNSITQGEQVQPLWGKLYHKYGIDILFAYRSFLWSNEAKGKAAVYCVIIAFRIGQGISQKRIYDAHGSSRTVSNINPYLVDAPNILIVSSGTPISDVPRVTLGNKPSDDGALILSPEQRAAMLARNPAAAPFIRRYVGSYEYIYDVERYCLWLKGTGLAWVNIREILERVEHVREFRRKSTAEPTRQKADTPSVFFSAVQPESDYILIPGVSSELRDYIPIGIMQQNVIASNATSIVHSSSTYHFGILTSSTHMAWMRAVAGRLKSDYRYSGSVVYNTFPWPVLRETCVQSIISTAEGILAARSQYPNAIMAVLYNPVTMPPELRKAHQRNDKAVMEAYGKDWQNEAECVADLMKLYQEATMHEQKTGKT